MLLEHEIAVGTVISLIVRLSEKAGWIFELAEVWHVIIIYREGSWLAVNVFHHERGRILRSCRNPSRWEGLRVRNSMLLFTSIWLSLYWLVRRGNSPLGYHDIRLDDWFWQYLMWLHCGSLHHWICCGLRASPDGGHLALGLKLCTKILTWRLFWRFGDNSFFIRND